MSHEYSENILVQENAGNLLRDELGWEVVMAYNKRFVREGFADDEQLTIYDLLFKENISKSDIAKLKRMRIILLREEAG